MKTFEEVSKEYNRNIATWTKELSARQIKYNLMAFEEIFDDVNNLLNEKSKKEFFENVITKDGLNLTTHNVLELQKKYCMLVGAREEQTSKETKLDVQKFLIKYNCYHLYGAAKLWLKKENAPERE